MRWWTTALFDTCSLITLDHLHQDYPSLSRMFPEKVLVLDVSLTTDQMRPDTSERMKNRVEFCSLPSPAVLAKLLASAELSKALAHVDKLIYATAVDSGRSVVTGDKRLAKAIQRHGLKVGNMALIMQELVIVKKLDSTIVEAALKSLANRKDFLLGIPNPTWNDLKGYKFPN